uniref:Putative salivary lipocalin n=1 Tax=Ixodes ricinus TaxID=34613 RepID=A0A0K8RGG7_IXORI
MKTIFRVSLMTLFAVICKAEDQCECLPGDILENLPNILEFRNAWDFLKTTDRLNLLYLPYWYQLNGKQCVTSEFKFASFTTIIRTINYINSLARTQKSETKTVTLTMEERQQKPRRSTYFTTNNFSQLHNKFPIYYYDSKCLIFKMTERSSDGRIGCALWVRDDDKDKELTFCKFIYKIFCRMNPRHVYQKQACDELVPKSRKLTKN